MIARAVAQAVLRDAIAACDPARVVAAVAAGIGPARDRWFGVAAGKAALAMARGFGSVARGLAVSPVDDDDGDLPAGWRAIVAGHPLPDARSVDAAREVCALIDDAGPGDRVIALISGGASALLEAPRVALAELRAITGAVMAAGAPIDELNTVRGALSLTKAGGLIERCAAPVDTLAISDVIGDRLDVIGSGPTVGPWLAAPGAPVDAGAVAEARRRAAIAILERRGIGVPAALAAPIASREVVRRDRAGVILGMRAFAEAAAHALARRGIRARLLDPPITGEVDAIADRLAAEPGPIVAWGEPTPTLPPSPGEGGRAQLLALALARRLRGTPRAALVAGSDGIDGPPPRRRPAPAGAYVDAMTWDRVRDPEGAIARADAGPALAAIGALVVTGPTGVNHADLVVVG